MTPFPIPEILRTPLQSLVMQAKIHSPDSKVLKEHSMETHFHMCDEKTKICEIVLIRNFLSLVYSFFLPDFFFCVCVFLTY